MVMAGGVMEVVIVGWGVCTVGVLSLSSTKSFAGEDLLLTSSDGCSRGFSMKLGSVVAEWLSICLDGSASSSESSSSSLSTFI